MFCSNCGNRLPEDALFCNQCGHRVRRPAPEPEPEPVFEPEPAPEPEPVFEPEPEPAPEPEPVIEPEPEPEPEPIPAAAPVVIPSPSETGSDRPFGNSRVIHSPKRPTSAFEPTRPAPSAAEQPLYFREEPEYERQEPVYEPETPPQYEPMYEREPAVPRENRPLSPWAYFGYGILFAIPVIGFILLIVFSFAGHNVNRKNFARSYWCKLIVIVAILLILIVLILLGVLRAPIENAVSWLRDTGLTMITRIFN